MHTLKFKVEGQNITRTDNEKPVAKCRNLFTAHFEFAGAEWTGIKTALFMRGSVSKAQVLDDKNECIVPWEFFNTDTCAAGYVSVYCGDLVTATAAAVRIYASGYTESDASVPPTTDVYQQLIGISEETKNIAQSVRDDADAGKFRGKPGPQGPAGRQGEKGDRGDVGPQGPIGQTGSRGPKGDNDADAGKFRGKPGPQGPAGRQGEKGDRGDVGPQGPIGQTGSRGPKGDTGAQGPQGPQGITGLQGATGKSGESAYQIAVKLGFKGTEQEWVESLKYDHSEEFTKLAEEVRNTANGIVADRQQITQNKNDVTTLKEDLGELNKVSEKILSVSIIQKCEVADGYYWNFIVGGKETKEINENYIAVKIPVKSNKLIVYGEFQDWSSSYVNNGAYTPVESTYISHNTQTSKVAEFYNIPADAKYLCLSFYKGGLDTSIESINVVSGEFRQGLSYRKTDFVNSVDVYTKDEVYTKEEVDNKLSEIHINKIYVATTGSDTEGNGTKEKPYATVLKANDIITDASEKNKYEIIVADGTYTDLQEKYKGQNGSDYQGIMAKSYVTYKSKSNNPEKCIFIWDGGVGYDAISNESCSNKCFFHINSVTINTVIKGFKFVGSNLRYCLHFESNCLTTPYIENCIFDWHGRDFLPKNGPVIGMGGSIFSHITFKDCKFLNSQNDAGIQWHDNTYPYDWMNGRYEPEGLCPKGAVIECIDCLFDNLNIQVRSQNEDRPMPCCLIVKNCGGLKNVYPTIIAGGTKNYWKLFNQCSFIKNDLLTDATETTTHDEMTSTKT